MNSGDINYLFDPRVSSELRAARLEFMQISNIYNLIIKSELIDPEDIKEKYEKSFEKLQRMEREDFLRQIGETDEKYSKDKKMDMGIASEFTGSNSSSLL